MHSQKTTGPASRPVTIPAGSRRIEGELAIPDGARAVIVFAHGSGSGRHSPRNQFVARVLNRGGFATLLLDLLEVDEAEDRHNVFDIHLLAGRLHAAADWLAHDPETNKLRLGYFGASTGAGAALLAAAERPDQVVAVVSRGGRPDLAGEALPRVKAPTMLIVGEADDLVWRLNERALKLLTCPKQLLVIPGATHLFPEPGALEEVAQLAEEWYQEHLGSGS